MVKKSATTSIPVNAPIWLFIGPEIGERNDEVQRIRSELEKRAGSLDCHSLYASETPIGSVVSLLQNGNLFASSRFVVLRDAEVIKKKEDIDLLFSWCISSSSVPDEAQLVLVSDETAVDKKLESIVPQGHKKVFWEMFENRKEQWIRSYMKKLGCTVDQDGIEMILELVENNTVALGLECTRLAVYYPAGTTIGAKQVESILAHNREESPFTLFEKMTEADLNGALEIYNKLSASKNVSGIQIIALLAGCFRRLLDWHLIHYNHAPDDFELKRLGFGSSRAKEQYSRAARLWNETAASRILATLAETDMAIRTSGTVSESIRMELLLYVIIKKRGIAAEVPVYS